MRRQVAKYDLKKLADEGLLIPKGEKKARHYYAGKRLQEIREQTRSKQPLKDPFEELEKERQPEPPGFAPEAS
ncbi:MAG: hypothetical protein E6H47_13600 [Betaproteobacteria bacterium]|nr:MAG: hypothetical protein E6H47_13600 [Betaproteobacteria bacterium]